MSRAGSDLKGAPPLSTTATRIPHHPGPSLFLGGLVGIIGGLLISKGRNRHPSRGFDGSKHHHPSFSACATGKREAVGFLSSLSCVCGTDINHRDKDGFTHAHLSSRPLFQRPPSTVADLLLSHGSDHSIKGLNGQYAFMRVCRSGSERETVQVILNHREERARHQLSLS